jgi:hypothetical protein
MMVLTLLHLILEIVSQAVPFALERQIEIPSEIGKVEHSLHPCKGVYLMAIGQLKSQHNSLEDVLLHLWDLTWLHVLFFNLP